uniref:A18-like helicase n=1 Tax=Pithovirus LCPAC104 TaxID=2506589 RepID=A0A481Z783_9VIRU|nr:MAG: A18-like helicase [Pithovirus LCPAC104]
MAIRILKNLVTKEHRETIFSHLFLTPKKSNYSNILGRSENKGFLFAKIFDDDILLPYFYGKKLLNIKQKDHKTVSFNFKGELYDFQKSVSEDAIEHLKKYNTTTLNVYTAFGKTITGLYLATYLKRKTLILYHRTILEKTWKSTIEDFSDCKLWIVGNEMPEEFDIIMSMDTRFNKIPKNVIDSIGTLIIDEAHAFCTPSRISILLGTEPEFIISLTATFERENNMEIMIQSMCGLHKIFKISKKPFNVYKVNTGINFEIPLNKQLKPDWNNIVAKLIQNDKRNDIIINLVEKNKEYKILILTSRKKHVDILFKRLTDLKKSVDYMYGNKKKYTDSDILIGTISKIGTGFDEKSFAENFNGFRINLLIIVISIKNVQLLEQCVGRCFRSEFPNIITLVDDIGIIKNHFYRYAKNWYISRNGKIIEKNYED